MISRNIKLLKIQKFFSGIYPLSALLVVYFETITHSYTIAMTVLSILSLVKGISEIPTGILSDKIGRKKTLILSGFMFLISYLSWALASFFSYIPLLFIGALGAGLAQSLNHSTYDALMYETMEDLGKSDEFGNLYSKCQSLYHMGLLLSGFIATLVVFYFNSSPYSLQVLAWLAIIPIFGEFIPVILCVEPKKKNKNSHTISSFKHLKEALKLMNSNKKLRIFSILKILVRTSGACFARVAPVYYAQLIPLYLVTIVDIIKNVYNTISYFIASYFRRFGLEKCLFISGYIMGGIRLIGMALNNFLTPFIITTGNLTLGIFDTSLVNIMHDNFSKDQRATMDSIVFSLISFMSAITFYILGIIADAYSFRVAVLILILMRLFIVIYTYFKFKNLKL